MRNARQRGSNLRLVWLCFATLSYLSFEAGRNDLPSLPGDNDDGSFVYRIESDLLQARAHYKASPRFQQ